MNSIAYPLAQGRFINRFLQTPIEEKQERFATVSYTHLTLPTKRIV